VSELAHKYFTTPGKIADIRKPDTYVAAQENAKFTAEQIQAAKDHVVKMYTTEKSPDVTEEDAAAALDLLDSIEAHAESNLDEFKTSKPRKPRGKKVKDNSVEAVEEAEEADIDLNDLV
jgi:hypothetical protein